MSIVLDSPLRKERGRGPAIVLLSVAAALLCGCTVGPNYQRPAAPVPAHWDVAAPWRAGTPLDAMPKGQWWSVFQDPELSALEERSASANPTIQLAAAHLNQARALAQVQIATLFPTAGLAPSSSFPSAERQRLSGNRPVTGSVPPAGATTQNSFALPFSVSYEVDLFGQRRRSIESAQAAYQASAADLENARLVVAAELAGDFFTLRQTDAELVILERTVDSLQKGLDLVNSRHAGGVASGLDVAQEETLLEATRTQATLLLQQRKQIEDAIATLVGEPAPDFHLLRRELTAEPPDLDVALPSDLLERRPDIASAERGMAAANAQIGVAQAAYYPSIDLFAGGGWQSSAISKLVNSASLFWALGANVAESVFTGGARRARVQFAQSGYDATVASYRGTVLSAFQEVQDGVTGLEVLARAEKSQQRAVASARKTLDISTDRYKGGLVSYLDVVTAQQNLLANERQFAVIRGQRLVTSVLLVKALGGGWDAASIAGVHIKPRLHDIAAP